MTDFKLIRKWSQDKMLSRLRVIKKELDTKVPTEEVVAFDYPDEIGKLLDEVVIILLEVLNIVKKEKNWEISSLELFDGVFGKNIKVTSTPYKWVLQRYRETSELVIRYKSANKTEQARLAAKMRSRGMM